MNKPLSHATVAMLAWPIVLAQSATALTGIVDTAVMGRTGTAIDLAAVAIAAVTFSFLYWGFGFLRMGTTAQTAQARGAGDLGESHAVLLRALALGAGLGVLLLLVFPLLKWLALQGFQAEPAVENAAAEYMNARIWGAPAALTGFGISGWLLGTGRTRALLGYQVALNGMNAGFDAWFVTMFDWGPAGIGAGTALAEWLALGVGLFLVRDGFRGAADVWNRDRISDMMAANRDIMIRTFALLAAFAWFLNAGALVGSTALAGNQVLLQFIAVSAFVLDAFAFVAEKEVGEAVGAKDGARLRRAVRVTSELALVFGVCFAVAFYCLGTPIIVWMVADPAPRQVALDFLPWCALVPILGVPAWQLDGIFLGASRGKALRNAAVAATLLYLCADFALRPLWGNVGVWSAFLSMYVFRAVALGAYLPALLGETGAPARE